MNSRLSAALVTVALAASAASAQTPLGTAFTYQGRLENAGSPADGVHDLRFRLYDALTVGAQVGATVCFNNVNVTDGLFTVPLDFGAQYTGSERFLEISVRVDSGQDCTNSAGFVILSPRQALTATPYALQTRGLYVDDFGRLGVGTTSPTNLLTVHGGLFLSDVLDEDVVIDTGNFYIRNSDNLNPAYHYQSDPEQHEFFVGGGLAMKIASNGNVGIGTANPSADLDVAGTAKVTGNAGITFDVSNASNTTSAMAIRAVQTGSTENTYGVFAVANSTSGIGVLGRAAAGSGATSGVYGQNFSTTGYGVYGAATANSGTNFGVYGMSASSSGRGVYGEASAASGNTYGGFFASASTSGTAVFGSAGASTGLTKGGEFYSNSPEGVGVYAAAFATSGETSGVYGVSYSPFGHGVTGHAINDGSGVYGVGRRGGDFVGSVGVHGEGNTSGGIGGVFVGDQIAVQGTSIALGGPATGVYGRSDFSPSGRGVFGESQDNIGVYGVGSATSGTNYGVYGQSASTTGRGVTGSAQATFGVNYGVHGSTASSNGWGVYSSGDFGASGTKAFRIDHPSDPENKYLLHYAAESPFPQNFYSGNVVTDAQGSAWVELPDYFAVINANFKYQLTVVEDGASANFVQVKIGRKISGSRFLIMSSAPNVEVSWRVDADRNDLYVRQKQPQDVVDKQDAERGTYQHPELYGQPKEKGMDYDAERERPSPPSAAAVPAPVVGEREGE